jgi:hypothetical protein
MKVCLRLSVFILNVVTVYCGQGVVAGCGPDKQNPSLQANRSSRNSPHFLEPEGSLRYLQDPATCPYTEPEQSNHVFPSHLIKTRFNIILGLPDGLFPSGLPTKTLYAPSCAQHVLHVSRISFF